MVEDAEYVASVQTFALSLLSHREVRIRNAVAETLGVLARKNGASVWESCKDVVLDTITSNFVCPRCLPMPTPGIPSCYTFW